MAGGGRRRVKGGARRAFGALLVVAALAALVVLVAPRLVPGDRLAARAADALSATTGAKVTVGAASLSLVGGPGLRLGGVRLDARPAWDVTLEAAEVSLAVAPLLGRRVVVDRLALRGPQATAQRPGGPVTLGDFEFVATRLRLPVAGPGAAAFAGTADPGAALAALAAGDFRLRAAGAVAGELVLSAVEVEGRLEDRRLRVASFAAAAGGGRVSGSGEAAPFPQARDWEAALRLEGVDAAALVGPWAPGVAAQIDTRLTGDVRAHGGLAPGGSGASALASLTAEAHLSAGLGLVKAAPWLVGAGPYLGDRQDLVDIRLQSARIVARIEGGRCLVDTLGLRGPDTDWDLSGALELVAEAGREPGLDLAVHVRLPAGFTPQLGAMTFFAEAMRDGDGRVNLDLVLRGPLADPAVTLDLAAMSRRVRPS